MDEEQARETESEETREESGNTADEDGKPDAEMPDEEYGAAIDLDDEDLAGMLGL